MALWGKDDTFGRWLRLIIGLPLVVIGAFLEYNWLTTSWVSTSRWTRYGGLGMILLGGRCLWYAATGRDNVNHDDLNSGNFS